MGVRLLGVVAGGMVTSPAMLGGLPSITLWRLSFWSSGGPGCRDFIVALAAPNRVLASWDGDIAPGNPESETF